MSTFDEIIGYENIKTELMQVCDMLHNREVYKKLGAEVFWFSMDLNFLLKGYNETFDDIKSLF